MACVMLIMDRRVTACMYARSQVPLRAESPTDPQAQRRPEPHHETKATPTYLHARWRSAWRIRASRLSRASSLEMELKNLADREKACGHRAGVDGMVID